nr:ORF1a polyprotein [Jasmine virus A-1]
MVSFQYLTDRWNKIVNRTFHHNTNNNTTYLDVNKIKLSKIGLSSKSRPIRSIGKTPFKGRLSSLSFRPAELLHTKDDRYFLIPRRRFVDRPYLAALRKFFNLPFCRFKRMPVPIRRKFGNNFLRLFIFMNSLSSVEVGSSPAPTNIVTSSHVGLTAFGDGFKLHHLESKNIVDLFLCFGRRFENDCDLKFRLQFRANKKKKKNECFVLSALCCTDGRVQQWASQFRLFDRLSNLQFSAQCLLLSIIERSPRLALMCNYRVNQGFRNPVMRIRKFMIKECRGFKRAGELPSSPTPSVLVGSKSQNSTSALPRPRVDWFRCSDGSEGFNVVYHDGKEVSIVNDRFAVRKLFNLTLCNRKFFIHPKAFIPNGGRFESKPSEFCWLSAFALAGMKIPDWVVPFPSVTTAMLISCGLRRVLVGRLHIVAPGRAHFFVKRKAGPSFIPGDTLVGVRLNDDSTVSMKNLDVFFDDICTGVINQTAVRADNDLITNVVRRVSDRINTLSNKPRELQIRVSLSSSEKKKLTDLFPDITMEFTESSYSSHALFTAMRDCENFIMAKRMKFDNFIDAGGDVVSYVLKDSKNVHVCCPVVDVKDAQRHMTRSNILDRIVGINERVTICNHLCQDCDVKMSNIVAVEVYDMTLFDMAKSILKHGARRFDFSLIIPPEIISNECDLRIFNNSLHVVCSGGRVKYYYGDSGEAYLHDAEVLRDFLRVQVFSVDGVIFKKTLENSRECLHTFSLVPCFDFPNGDYKFFSHFKKSEQDKVLMYIPVRDKFGIIQNVKVKTDRSIVYHLLEYVMNTGALRVDDKSLEYLISQFRARKSVSIKGGKVIQTPFDLPLELYPGYLGVILGEGIRLREKTHYIAKMSYYKHYLPTVITIIFAYIHRCCSQVKQFVYNSALSALKLVMSEDFIEEIVNGDRRIFDIDEVFEFSQEVSAVGDCNQQLVLNKSFSSFVEDSKLTTERIDNAVVSFQERFKESEDDILRDLILSGGGSSLSSHQDDKFSNSDTVSLDDIPSFELFLKVRKTLSLISNDKSKVDRFTHIITKVVHYFIRSGKSVYNTLKEVVMSLLRFFRDGSATISGKLRELIRRCVNSVDRKINSFNNDSVDHILKQMEEEEGPESDSEDSGSYKSANSDFDELPTSEPPQLRALVLSGGGSRDWFYSIAQRLQSFFSCIDHILKNFRKRICERFSHYATHASKIECIPETLLRGYHIVVRMLTEWLYSEDGARLIIEGIAFSFTNFIYFLMIGKFSFWPLILSSIILVSLKISGIEKKYLGYGFITSQIASAVSPSSGFNLLTLPVRFLFSKSVEQRLKLRMLRNDKTREIASQLIARDVLSVRYYDLVSNVGLRSVLCIALLMSIWCPYFTFSVVLCDQKKYVNSIVMRANVALSFASDIKRTIKSGRLLNFKNLLKKKFDANRKSYTEDTLLGDEATGARPFRSERGDDDISVEFDYDGSYVELPRKEKTWASEVSSASSSSEWESLNVSVLRPTEERKKIRCSVSFGLSDVILNFPLSANESLIESGDLKVDSLAEYYYLESQKLVIELGRLDNLVRTYHARIDQRKTFRDTVWDLRNCLDDSTLYISNDNDKWYRLRRGDVGPVVIDGRCKMTLEQELLEFSTRVNGVCFCSDELIGMYTNHRCLGLENLKSREGELPTVEIPSDTILFNKPPGAGKTTEIVNRLLEDINERRKAMALTCTSAGKREITSKLLEKGVATPHKYVSTYDSVLMRASHVPVSKLYCDEVFMIHAGQWLSCIELLRPAEIKCFGDKNQIPYINRVANTVCKYGSMLFDSLETVHDNVSYRCPPDVCYILSNLQDSSGNKLYPNGVYSAGPNSGKLRSLYSQPIHGAEDIELDEDSKCITFSQPEKDEMSRVQQKRGGNPIPTNTVNEVQGSTFPVVNLIRLRQYDNPLYSNVNQFVVAISRHTDRMCYKVISSKMNDYVSNSIGALSTVSDFVIKEFKYKQRV